MNFLICKILKRGKTVLKPVLVSLLIFSWLLTGWPTIPYLNFPPQVKDVLAAAPVIESGDITGSGSNATGDSTPDISYPATVDAGDLLIVWIGVDQQRTITPPGNLTEIMNDSCCTAGPSMYVGYEIADGDEDGGTVTFSLSTGDSYDGGVIRVPTGEFDASDPIGNISSVGIGTSGTDPTANMPAFTGDKANARVVAIGAVDADPMDATFSPSGWTDRYDNDRGAISTWVATRDAPTTAAESIASADFGINTGDTNITVGFEVNEPAGPPDVDQIHYRWRNDDGSESSGPSWLNSNWEYRKRITIDADEVSGSGDLSNFPVLISITDDDLRTTGNGGEVIQSDGGDIAFTNSSSTQLDHEIESYDASTGALIAWVEVPTLSGASDTDIYIYYGNSTDGGNQWDINGTWDGAGFETVYHLAEDPSINTDGHCGGGSSEVCDSTLNTNHGDTGGSMTTGDLIGAQIGNGLDFDGTNDFIDAGSDIIESDNDFSVSIWARTNDSGFALLFDERDNDFIGTVLEIGFEGAGIPAFVVEGNSNAAKAIGPSNIADNQWYHLVGVWNESTQTASLYINGSLADSDSVSVGTSEVNDRLGISIQSAGTSGGLEGGGAFQGVLDEARIIPSTLTADWIATEYNNQDSPGVGGFLASIGSEETEGGGDVATWAAAEDTALEDVVKETQYRLRIELSNEGEGTDGGATHQLQVAETATCSGGSYSAVPTDTSGHWQIVDSTYITDGSASTNVSGGLTDEATTFVSGELKDTGNTTGSITLGADEFTEIEFSIEATTNATDGGDYCFRLTNVDTYTIYAQASIQGGSVTFTQNQYRFYVDNDSTNPTEVWGNPDIAENTAIAILPATNDPPSATQEIRLRVNITIGGGTMSASSQQFKLQYKAGTDATCTTGSWTDVAGSATWEFATSGVTDGATITGTLTSTDVNGQYAKSNPTTANANSVSSGEDIEYDFHLIGTNISGATRYSFRVVESDDSVFSAYTNCPTLTTEPTTSQLLRHGNVFSEQIEQGFFWAD